MLASVFLGGGFWFWFFFFVWLFRFFGVFFYCLECCTLLHVVSFLSYAPVLDHMAVCNNAVVR